jgi:hypothetical protein
MRVPPIDYGSKQTQLPITKVNVMTAYRIFRIAKLGRLPYKQVLGGEPSPQVPRAPPRATSSLSKTPEVIATNPKLGERVSATPAIANDTIYIRTAGHLYAFAEVK